MRMAEVLGAYRDRLFMIEQPFPVEMPMDQDGGPSAEEWKNVRESLGWKIYADESFRTAADVAPLRPYVHGVNIKMEKSWGLPTSIARCLSSPQNGHGHLAWMHGGLCS